MTPAAYLSKQNPLLLAAAGIAVLAVVYFGGRAVVAEVAQAAGGVVTGNNALTENQTNAAGEKVTAYQGAGIFGTLGAAANSASGGALASLGETLGGWAFDIFGPKAP